MRVSVSKCCEPGKYFAPLFLDGAHGGDGAGDDSPQTIRKAVPVAVGIVAAHVAASHHPCHKASTTFLNSSIIIIIPIGIIAADALFRLFFFYS
jgi:hypothetical protein